MAANSDESADSVALTRSLHRSGNSTVLTIPTAILEEAGLERGEDIEFSVNADGEIVLRESSDEQPDE